MSESRLFKPFEVVDELAMETTDESDLSLTKWRLRGLKNDDAVLLAALRSAEDGLTRTEIGDLFARHKRAPLRWLLCLQAEGYIYATIEGTTGGRPATRWRIATAGVQP